MRAKRVMIKNKGDIDQIAVTSYDVPSLKDNEVLIQVTYAGVAYGDVMLRKANLPGLPKTPVTPGADIVGIIKDVGPNVQDLKVGDYVSGLLMSDFGGQAQYVTVETSKVRILPDGIAPQIAVCLLINYLTAYQMLNTYMMTTPKKHPTILVHGGSGGVGSALVQLALAYDMNVISTASTKNIAFLENMGAKPIDYTHEDFWHHIKDIAPDLDAVFDPIGGRYTKRSSALLTETGSYISYGFQGVIQHGFIGLLQAIGHFYIQKWLNKNRSYRIFQLNDFTDEENLNCLDVLYDLVRAGKISPHVSHVYPLHEVQSAYRNLESGSRQGKVLLSLAQ